MASISGAVQIETRIKHDLSIAFQSVVGEQSINVGTLVIQSKIQIVGIPKTQKNRAAIRFAASAHQINRILLIGTVVSTGAMLIIRSLINEYRLQR